MNMHVSPPQNTRRAPSEFDLRTGRLLRRKRLAADLSMETVGGRIGVSHQCYQRCETGQIIISLSRLLLLGKAIGFDPQEFLAELLADQTSSRKIQREMKDGWPAKAVEAISRLYDVKDKRMVLAFAKRLARKS